MRLKGSVIVLALVEVLISPTVAQPLLLSVAEVVSELDGNWRTENTQCAAPQGSLKAPMIVTNGVFSDSDHACSLQSAKLINNTLSGVLACEGEEAEWAEQLLYDRAMSEMSKGDLTYESCPE